MAQVQDKLGVVVVLGTTQTLAWASSYYLPAILADQIASELGIATSWFFAAFSAALVVAAFVGPRAGRTVDAIGGREVLAASNIIFAAGLAALAFAHSQTMLWLAWLIMGVSMGIGLYDTAFATLGRIYGMEARSAITGITLLAGFASTIGWPLTAWGAAELGWRETCLAWSAAHLLLGLPLNCFLLPRPTTTIPSAATHSEHIEIDRTMVLLGLAFAASWMVVAAMAVHLPRILEAAGATAVQAVAAGALIGPAQVAARLLEASLLKRFHPMISARLIAVHGVFLTAVVIFSHHAIVFLALFLFFLGFTEAYRRYQSRLMIREGLMVAFFLAGLVVLGGQQKWWLQPLLADMGPTTLYFGATLLTAITDNAALTYLGSQVDGISEAFKYSMVAGAVTGGGLTVIANAPNPAGYAILKDSFEDGSIGALGLLAAATPPTLVAIAAFQLLPG